MADEQTPQQPENAEVPQAQPPAEQAPPAATGDIASEAKTMAMLCHLLAIFTGFLAPLIIWLVKKDSSTYVDEQGKESLNFQISVALALLAAGILTPVTCGFGVILFPIIGICDLIFCIIATVKVNNGEHYRYPFALRLIK